MSKSNEICKILIVDNDVEYARQIAYELEQIRPDLLNNQVLNIEISNTAYFVANQLENRADDKPHWDIIISDVYMPIPSNPIEREIAQKTAEPQEIRYENYKWKFWRYSYTWNSHLDGSPDNGGLYLAKEIKRLKESDMGLYNLKVVLISDKLIDPSARKKVLEFLRSERTWFNFYDKADWDEDTEDWPEHLNDPNVFKWAVIHAINERNSETWGDFLENDDETFLAVSKSMKEISTKCKTLAKDPSVDTMMITGERGIGKSMLARTIHNHRMKASGGNGKFVTVECTSISDELFEGRLFGHKKGAYTGAVKDEVGFIETAKNGTLFFDEIGDLSPTNQGKILRLLQDKEFVIVGGTTDIKMKVNLVIFATNKNLEARMEADLFRPDLYDRMKPPPLQIPPLRNRREEIIPLAEHFLNQSNSSLTISEDAKQFLIKQPWEGNVRQLKNTITKAATFCTSKELKVADFRKFLPMPTDKMNAAPQPYINDQNKIDITPENIVAGRIKWAHIIKEPYDLRSAIMIIVRSMWKKPQKELAKLLDVNPNSLEQFFSTLKRKIKNGELDLQHLRQHVTDDHHPILEQFCI